MTKVAYPRHPVALAGRGSMGGTTSQRTRDATGETAADPHPLTGRWPFVGRHAELTRFSQVLADRWSQGFVVCGPPGAGRSRLVEECLISAVDEGYHAVRAAASAAASTVPYGAIAHLLPPDVDPANPVAGFVSVSKALAGTARNRLVVLVDDLHLLDAASVVLTRQLMDVGLIFLIGTIRTDGSVTEAMEVMRREDSIHRVDLAEFDQDTVEELLRTVFGGPVGRRTLHELFSMSGGNVLYLRELVLGALQTGALASDGTLWELAKGARPLTPRLTELINARLASAGGTGRPLLELLSLCEPLGALDVAARPQTLIDLEQAGLIRASGDGRRVSLTLAHPLYGKVLRAQTPLIRRRAMLLRQAERIEAHGARRGDDALRVASWRLAATGTADPALLVRAAATAHRAHDPAGVLALLSKVPAEHHTTGSRLLYGEALMETGRCHEAEAVLAGVYEQASTDRERRVATRMRTHNLFWMGARTKEALELNDEALARAPHGADRELLLIDRATMITMSGRPAEGVELLDPLPREALRTQDVNGWLMGTSSKATGLALLGRTREAWSLAEAAERAHRAHRQDEQALLPPAFTYVLPLTHAAAENGRLALAREIGARGTDDLLTGRGGGYGATWNALSRARVEWLAGRVATARHWYAEAAAPARAHHHLRPLRLILSGLCATSAVLGDVEVAEAALDELHTYPGQQLFAGEELLGEAWLLAVRGQLAEARKTLVRAAATARDTGQLTCEALLLTDVARLGGARQVAGRLATLAGMCDGRLRTVRARMAAALAANDPERLVEVADMLQDIGADLLAAEAATTAAQAWRQNGALRQAAAAVARAVELRTRCEGADTPLLATGHEAVPLTARERDIALLAAGGTASKDIARTLVLSVRTVDNHLQKIYTKLGVTTRRDLAHALRGRQAQRIPTPAPPPRLPPLPGRHRTTCPNPESPQRLPQGRNRQG
ncbi:LuxR C-terminal-related transcriptional regulator [Sphaerisporangium sp. NBC_01403]|uniref:LuxR C-terminal-related transcriptional regulator n=1 Tax=Sphaerisporangium sp. NBC_01403 TaxID=2903599 RepID=UPI00324AC852